MGGSPLDRCRLHWLTLLGLAFASPTISAPACHTDRLAGSSPACPTLSSSLNLFDDAAAPFDAGAALLHLARPSDAEHHDELRDAKGQLRPQWQQFAGLLGGDLGTLNARQAALTRQIQEDGVTYNVYNAEGGPSRPWSLETLPLILSASDWSALEKGVAQRASLLNGVLQDIYSEQRLLKDALLPSALVLGHPGYLRGLQGVQPVGGIHLHVLAFDLVRGPDGAWWVVSQRTQAPSGLGYVMQNRLIVSRLYPEAYRAMHVQHLAKGYRRMLDTLTEMAAKVCRSGEPRLALLTPGPYNETYFEHAYLARYLGLPLVEGGDLVVRNEALYMKTVQGLEPLHGLLRRLDDNFCDPLELRSDSTLGVPGLMQAVRAGKVVLANALGTGFLESPAIHGFLPALSRRVLGEELKLPSLPTWWCGEEAAWADVRDELDDKVIRPSFGYAHARSQPEQSLGRLDAVIGNGLSEEELATWRRRIDEAPAQYTVQHYVPYPQAPVWAKDKVLMRGASVRVYALSDGQGGWQVLPGGMTRIATREAGPVSMQLGGSSLDTWVLTDDAVDTFSMLHSAVHAEELLLRQRPVASRTGENLFWMGRYAERSEQQWRLVNNLIGLQAGDDAALESVLKALSALSGKLGLVPTGTPGLNQSPRVFERAVLSALGDARARNGANSLASNLGALERSAQVLRERLSPEHARWLRAVGQDFQRSLTPAPTSLSALTPALEHLGMQLAAVTGAQSDRMTRDAGWRLLTVGRLIERLTGYASMMLAFWQHDALLQPQGYDQLLDLFDSAITFRARFQRRLETPALLALLVLDESNPRSLACVLRRLRTEVAKLPLRAQASHKDLLSCLPAQGVGATMAELSDEKDGHAAMVTLLEGLITSGWRLSDEVGRNYFAHAETQDAMVSA
jgi:uncharacterized circularly permuted ATP-grasp superfamily protein/uncharacterized alpha-E superfamily protein